MSEGQGPGTPEDLQFDKAAYKDKGGGQSACAICKGVLPGSYYNINGAVSCPDCKTHLEKNVAGTHSAGGMGKALLFGIPAAILGSVIYFAIMVFTGYEFGLVAILIGWMVGQAVRKGSGGCGGRGYQVLAVLLTYVSICSTNIPGIVAELKTNFSDEASLEGQQTSLYRHDLAIGARVAEAAPEVITDEDAAAMGDHAPVNAPAHQPAPVQEKVTFFQIVLAWGFVVLIALAAPFLGGFQNIIGLVIIGIGLWEAWKLNKKLVLNIQGPFEVKPSA